MYSFFALREKKSWYTCTTRPCFLLGIFLAYPLFSDSPICNTAVPNGDGFTFLIFPPFYTSSGLHRLRSFIEDVERGAELSFSGALRGPIKCIVCIIVKSCFQTTKFWFQTDRQTDGRTDGRSDRQTQ